MAGMTALVMGQGPRPEVSAAFAAVLGDASVAQVGCLDGLDRDAIAALAPAAGEPALFTRLPSGEGVALSKAAVVARGGARLAALDPAPSRPVIVLCTGDFPEWERPGVLFPSRILRRLAPALLPAGTLGVLTPLESQLPDAAARWSADGHRVAAEALSPNATAEACAAAGAALARGGADLVVFDCVSYTPWAKRIVLDAALRPGLLAITTVARVAAELLDRGEA